MSDRDFRHDSASPGFSLIEVLVALAIAALMITLIAPLSRQALRMMNMIERDIALYQQSDPQVAFVGESRNTSASPTGIYKSQTRRRLPLFPYEATVMQKWQPVLVSMSAEKEGRRIMIEVITLEQDRE